MRTGLIAAVTRTATGELRAELPVAGRSVLAWQVALMRDLRVERILCLCEDVRGEVLRLQHEVEAGGGAFHALKGFAARMILSYCAMGWCPIPCWRARWWRLTPPCAGWSPACLPIIRLRPVTLTTLSVSMQCTIGPDCW